MTAGFPFVSTSEASNTPRGKGSDANSPTTLKRKTEGLERRQYVTRTRTNEIAAKLRHRDRAVIEDLQRVHVLSGEQIRRLHYENTASGKRLARLDLARLTEWRVVSRLGRRVGGERAGSDGYIYALDVLGQRIAQPAQRRYRDPWTPGAAFLTHALAVSELYVSLREHSELLRFDSEPRCWRRFSGPGGRNLVLKPDAYAVVGAHDYENHYFIEIDCGTESLPRITEKARLYGRHWRSGREQAELGIYPQVVWIAPDEDRRTGIATALGRLDPELLQLFLATTAASPLPELHDEGDR